MRIPRGPIEQRDYIPGAPEGNVEDYPMSRRAAQTGKAAQTGHKVSHSNRKTKRRFLPNL